MKAALALAKHAGVEPLAEFRLVKTIPTESGLGGGSADAAATLVACNRLWDLRYSYEQLESIGAGIGEDVPFLIRGMMAIGTGHLEPLIPLEVGSSTFHWMLGIPNIGLATAAVYSMYDQMTEQEPDLQCFRNRQSLCLSVNWGTRDPISLATLLTNDLEKAAIALLPDIKFALEAGRSAGAIASTITGTGSTCVFLAENSAHAETLAVKLSKSSIFRKVLTATGPVRGV
jgi:4-diphosphocytidyl-2-C-methyl-D-erythritol kinase